MIPRCGATASRCLLAGWADRNANVIADLDVAVHVIGAGGEKSQHLEWPPGSAALNLTEDVEVHHTARDHTDIDGKGRL